MDNVVYLRGQQPQPVARFLRIGSSGHGRLEQFLAAGQLPVRRFVVEAGAFKRQSDLIDALRQNHCEIVLDTNVAELSAIVRYQGTAVPEPRRSQHFLNNDLAQADRTARQVANLRLSDARLAAKMPENSRRLDRMRVVLENLEKTATSATRSPGFPRISSAKQTANKDGRR